MKSVCHDEEAMWPGAWGLIDITYQEAENDECWSSAHLVLFMQPKTASPWNNATHIQGSSLTQLTSPLLSSQAHLEDQQRISEVRLNSVRLIMLTSQWSSFPSVCLPADTQYETQTLKVSERFGDLSCIFHEQRQRNLPALSASCTPSSVHQAQALGTNHDFLYL